MGKDFLRMRGQIVSLEASGNKAEKIPREAESEAQKKKEGDRGTIKIF
jgi:hypothetical protein